METFDKRAVYDELEKAVDFLRESDIDYCPLNFRETNDEIPCDNSRVTAGMYRKGQQDIYISIEAIEEELKNDAIFRVCWLMFNEYEVHLSYINYALWALFHELGHYHHRVILKTDYNTEEFDEAIAEVKWRVFIGGSHSYEAHKAYRMIPSERDADEFAFDLLHKYFNYKEEEV